MCEGGWGAEAEVAIGEREITQCVLGGSRRAFTPLRAELHALSRAELIGPVLKIMYQ